MSNENPTQANAASGAAKTGPRPGPKPGPRPGPRPGARAAATPVVPVVVPPAGSFDPSEFGRIDEDGTAWVKTADGERQIGSWQAGTKEEGLKHFASRYQDIVVEVELLEARIVSHPDEAPKLKKAAEEIAATLPEATVIGDLPALEKRLATVMTDADHAGEKAKHAKEERRSAAIARKEELAAEAEAIGSDSTEWKAAGDRLRAILDEWKTIRGVDRKTDDVLWKRYSRARDAFNRRRGSHFAELDRNRAKSRDAKEELVERAEAIQDSTDWNDTARAFASLMQEWKAAGRAPREIDDKLWARFKAAQDHFFAARNEDSKQRDEEFEANAAAKDALIAEYDALIDPDKDLEKAKNALRDLQEKWEAIGYVPRGRVREYETKIRDLEGRVQSAEDKEWRRNDPEAQNRANQFIVKAEEFEAQAAKFDKAGKKKKADEARASAAQWREWANAALSAVEDR